MAEPPAGAHGGLEILGRTTSAPPGAEAMMGNAMTGTTDEDHALTEVVKRLVAAYQPERIYLFGSTARGEAGPDSDYDLLVIVPDEASDERRRSRLAYTALHGTGIAADVLVCTHRYFEERLHLRASLPATVLREGKLLHAA